MTKQLDEKDRHDALLSISKDDEFIEAALTYIRQWKKRKGDPARKGHATDEEIIRFRDQINALAESLQRLISGDDE